MSGRRRGACSTRATARDIVRGVVEDQIGPHQQVHRATNEGRN